MMRSGSDSLGFRAVFKVRKRAPFETFEDLCLLSRNFDFYQINIFT